MELAESQVNLPVPLESVICTQELNLRAARAPDFQALNGALVTLARTLATSRENVLQELVQAALELCQAGSAGISLLEEEEGRNIFRWHALAGEYEPHLWGTTPREFSPCGTVLDTDAVQLMSRLDRHFGYFAQVKPRISEALLVPFHVGGNAVGTVWVISHDETRQFDAEDARVMETMAEFAAAVYQALSETLTLKNRYAALKEDSRLGRGLPLRLSEETVQLTSRFDEFVGTSEAVRQVLAQVEVVAPTDATVLIQGETGTGKELIARALHRLSHRKNLPFVSLNCAAIPSGLLESELFGFERGAFTGAVAQKIGRFEMANGGTLFLDEVGDIPVSLQPKLLRALQEKSFERLGGTRTIPIDVRLVTATNRDLSGMMAEKLFRSDLYYRLMVFPIVSPPLRDHPQDIPKLVRHFAGKFAAQMGRTISEIPAATMRALTDWPWPGNVRELENLMERSVILSRGPTLCVPLEELRPSPAETGVISTLEEMERDHISRALRDAGGVIRIAANRLGVPRNTLNAMIRRLGISRAGL
jgi:transcriptional regulator with GAF, ATPase, and Fis domain